MFQIIHSEPEGLVFKHYAMGLTGEREVHVEGIVRL